jgi:hypothetical protein
LTSAGVLATVSIGLLLVRPLALTAAKVLLIAASILIPLGIVNPGYVSDLPDAVRLAPGFVTRTFSLAYGLSAVCLGLAYVLDRGRLHAAETTGAQDGRG